MTTIEQHIDLIKEANKITNRKTLYAAGAGLIPIPIVDTATLLGVQLTMVRSIGNLYGVKFKKHIVKSLIGSLIGSISSVGLVKLIPGLGTLLGGAAAATTGAAATYALGRVFTQHFDQGGTLLDFDPITSREYFHTEYEAGRMFVGQQNLVPQEGAATAGTPKQLLIDETDQLQNELAKLQQEVQELIALRASKGKEQKTAVTEYDHKDDFTIIEGIGPKVEQVLKAAGINSMVVLSTTKADELRTILRQAGPKFNFADPSSWPEQATLVAEGKMEELKALQAELLGGKTNEK